MRKCLCCALTIICSVTLFAVSSLAFALSPKVQDRKARVHELSPERKIVETFKMRDAYNKGFAFQTRAREVNTDGVLEELTYKTVDWDPAKTAVIVCDMWDKHWCKGATSRVAEMTPRMNEFLKKARAKGATIIHAPSETLEFYKDNPARKRAQAYKDYDAPEFMNAGADTSEAEKDTTWPIDQSDGGCDCETKCQSGSPWKSQIDTLEIDADKDIISDSGVEIAGYMADKGIENVILVGVHTNMCVIGRPFGLRNMVRLGKNVLLVRDLTDTMYDSRKPPVVPHVRGTELIINHIESYVCPTTTSASLLDGPEFRFKQDDRPHVSMIVSDDHYCADFTMPLYAEYLRDKGYYCTVQHGEQAGYFPTFDNIKSADVLMLFVRRQAITNEQMKVLQDLIKKDGDLTFVILRTASHGLAAHKLADGLASWPTLDREVFGGAYGGHAPRDDKPGTDVRVEVDHPITTGMPKEWHTTGCLYFASNIGDDVTVLMQGSSPKAGVDKFYPVVWLHEYQGDRSDGTITTIYTSLGHWQAFDLEPFMKMMDNIVEFGVKN